MVAKRSARSTKIKTLNQIRHLGFTAPDELRERLKGCSREHLAAEAAALRPRPGGDAVMVATKTALRTLGRRVLALDDEKATLDELLVELVTATAPGLLGVHGVGVDTAASLLVTAGDNPPAAFRGRLGAPVRCRPDRSLLRQGDPLPAQPRW